LDEEVAALIATLERDLDERAWALQDNDGDVIEGAWDEYLAYFKQARAATALRFLFGADAATAVSEAIYEAGAASDEYLGYRERLTVAASGVIRERWRRRPSVARHGVGQIHAVGPTA
jgi:hypothetical protein